MTTNMDKVIFELDDQQVYRSLVSPSTSMLEFGMKLNDWVILKNQLTDVSFRWIRRNANKATHTLARVAVLHAYRVTYNFVPPYLDFALLFDSIHVDTGFRTNAMR